MNLFDVTIGFKGHRHGSRDEARSATIEERDAYLADLAKRRGISVPAGARFEDAGIKVAGEYVLEMPGYGAQPAPTVDMLDDAGNVIRSMPLAIDDRGRVKLDAKQVQEMTGLQPVKRGRGRPRKAVAPLEAVSAPIVAIDAPAPAPAIVEPVRSTLPNPLDMLDAIEALQRQVAELVANAAKPVAIVAPAPANDATEPLPVAPKRTEAERRAILRAWRMRGDMRARADLDRRALLAANAANTDLRETLERVRSQLTDERRRREAERDRADMASSHLREAQAQLVATEAARATAIEQHKNARRAATGYKTEMEVLERENAQMRMDLAARPGDRQALLEANTTIGRLERRLETANRRLALRPDAKAA